MLLVQHQFHCSHCQWRVWIIRSELASDCASERCRMVPAYRRQRPPMRAMLAGQAVAMHLGDDTDSRTAPDAASKLRKDGADLLAQWATWSTRWIGDAARGPRHSITRDTAVGTGRTGKPAPIRSPWTACSSPRGPSARAGRSRLPPLEPAASHGGRISGRQRLDLRLFVGVDLRLGLRPAPALAGGDDRRLPIIAGPRVRGYGHGGSRSVFRSVGCTAPS